VLGAPDLRTGSSAIGADSAARILLGIGASISALASHINAVSHLLRAQVNAIGHFCQAISRARPSLRPASLDFIHRGQKLASRAWVSSALLVAIFVLRPLPASGATSGTSADSPNWS